MFKVVEFDRNNDADSVCKELFKDKAPFLKHNKKIKTGRVTKKKIKKNANFKSENIKDELKNILNDNNNGSQNVAFTKIQNKANIGKVIKKKNKKNTDVNIQKIRDNIKHITNNNNDLSSSKKFKTKRKKFAAKEDHQKEEKLMRSRTEENQEGNSKKQKKKKKKRKEEPQKDIAATRTEEHQEGSSIKQKKKKKKRKEEPQKDIAVKNVDINSSKTELQISNKEQSEKIEEKIKQTSTTSLPLKKQKFRNLSLRERMMAKLQAARFRYINEQIYSTVSTEAQKIFTEDPEAFTAYHQGYRQQVNKWPLNPVDIIISSVQKLPKDHIIADFGCGDAKLAKSVTQKVYSFDLVAMNNLVVACDMAHVPLEASSVDVVVFCLSLMGTNLHDYLLEANRVLKVGGILKIAEVESRFEDVNQFIEALKRFNFKNIWKDLSHNLFYFLDFKKEANVKKKKLPQVTLNPCLYKKR